MEFTAFVAASVRSLNLEADNQPACHIRRLSALAVIPLLAAELCGDMAGVSAASGRVVPVVALKYIATQRA